VVGANGAVVAVVRSRLNLTAIWTVVEADANSVGAGAHSFLLDDYGIRLAVSETKNNRDKAASFVATSGAIGLLLSFIVGIMLTRSLVRPLRQLVGIATSVSTGDTDLRAAHFETRHGDDITREVASAFDRLLNALRFYAFADEPGEE
jgi:methyl-accepting chemotaxis protein